MKKLILAVVFTLAMWLGVGCVGCVIHGDYYSMPWNGEPAATAVVPATVDYSPYYHYRPVAYVRISYHSYPVYGRGCGYRTFSSGPRRQVTYIRY